MIGAAAASGFRFALRRVAARLAVRPRLRGRHRASCVGIAAFGVAAAVMNLCFFQAVARLPLGTAVSIEFLGPFTLAVVAGRAAPPPTRSRRSGSSAWSCSLAPAAA